MQTDVGLLRTQLIRKPALILCFFLSCVLLFPFSFKSSFPLQVLRGVQKSMLGNSSWLGESKRV